MFVCTSLLLSVCLYASFWRREGLICTIPFGGVRGSVFDATHVIVLYTRKYFLRENVAQVAWTGIVCNEYCILFR